MKKIFAGVLAWVSLLSLGLPALAAEDAPTEAAAPYTITVNGTALDLSGLPLAPYKEGDTVMVPLRKIGEALGYLIQWDPETQAITVEDRLIQAAVLFDGAAEVVFAGKLKIIDMSRTITNPAPTAVHSGCTYVPAEFFREFFNDVQIEGPVITIAPSMSELHAAHPVP